jgi:hypothetical protein
MQGVFMNNYNLFKVNQKGPTKTVNLLAGPLRYIFELQK